MRLGRSGEYPKQAAIRVGGLMGPSTQALGAASSGFCLPGLPLRDLSSRRGWRNMTPHHRPIAILLLGLHVAGCYGWHARDASQIVSEGRPSAIRVTMRDGNRLVLDQPAVRNDSIVSATHRLGVGDIASLEVRRMSALRTGGLVIGIPVAIVVIGALIFFSTCEGGCISN